MLVSVKNSAIIVITKNIIFVIFVFVKDIKCAINNAVLTINIINKFNAC